MLLLPMIVVLFRIKLVMDLRDQFDHELTFLQRNTSFVKKNRTQARLATNSPCDPIVMSDNAKGNNASDAKPDTDHAATEKSDQATKSAGQPLAWSADPSTASIWLPFSSSWSSSSTLWWPDTGWQDW